jgi:hypothetical protein
MKSGSEGRADSFLEGAIKNFSEDNDHFPSFLILINPKRESWTEQRCSHSALVSGFGGGPGGGCRAGPLANLALFTILAGLLDNDVIYPVLPGFTTLPFPEPRNYKA